MRRIFFIPDKKFGVLLYEKIYFMAEEAYRDIENHYVCFSGTYAFLKVKRYGIERGHNKIIEMLFP